MSQIELWPSEPIIQSDQVKISFELEDALHERQRYWYRLSAELQNALSPSCDPFLLPAVFIAMQKGSDLRVHGQISPSLLKNLAEFQATWAAWRPGIYTPVEITAELERENEPQTARLVITTFSGGVDSAFTVWRHREGLAGRQTQPIQAGLMIHGFDIRLNQPDVFNRSVAKAQSFLDSMQIKLLTMSTNLKKTGINFDDAHAAVLASCMMLLQGSYSTALIPSSYPLSNLYFPWGSNPITDRLLSSDTFKIIHDGAAFARLDKIIVISKWPAATRYLRVCLRGESRDENCCRCEKCTRTILEFRAAGLGLPTCFEHDVSIAQILRLKIPRSTHNYRLVLKTAKAYGVSGLWVQALRWAVFWNDLKLKAISVLRKPRRIR
jgi:hypothetical protein